MKIVTIYNFKDSDIVQNHYLGFWGLPNDYDSLGILRMYNTKEEAIKKLNKIRIDYVLRRRKRRLGSI